MLELELAKDLRNKANDLYKQVNRLNSQANEIEKAYFESQKDDILGNYYLDYNTYYKVLEVHNTYSVKCFSIFIDDDNTCITSYEHITMSGLNAMKKVTRMDAELALNKLFEFTKKEFLN